MSPLYTEASHEPFLLLLLGSQGTAPLATRAHHTQQVAARLMPCKPCVQVQSLVRLALGAELEPSPACRPNYFWPIHPITFGIFEHL